MSAVGLGWRARSAQIVAAARLMAVGWGFSLQFWLLFDGDALVMAYLLLDSVLATAFFQMSRGRWFPAPLFFLHLFTVALYLYVLLVDQDPFWMLATLNRAFELALLYIVACALFRIRRLQSFKASG